MKLCKKLLHSYEGKQCKECLKIWQKANAAYLADLNKQYVRANKERLHLLRVANRLKKAEQYKAVAKKYREANKGKRTAQQKKRDEAKSHRTPKWLSKAQFKEIEQFYIKAAELTQQTGIKHEVDHILPLRGKTVSGLHVPWNLQILTEEENMKKGNRI